MSLENVRDRTARDPMAQIRESTLDSAIAPVPTLRRHSNHQFLDDSQSTRPTGSSALAAIVLPSDQIPMPSQQRIRCDDGCHLSKDPTAQFLGFGSQKPALVVAESKPLVPELLPENPIL